MLAVIFKIQSSRICLQTYYNLKNREPGSAEIDNFTG